MGPKRTPLGTPVAKLVVRTEAGRFPHCRAPKPNRRRSAGVGRVREIVIAGQRRTRKAGYHRPCTIGSKRLRCAIERIGAEVAASCTKGSYRRRHKAGMKYLPPGLNGIVVKT